MSDHTAFFVPGGVRTTGDIVRGRPCLTFGLQDRMKYIIHAMQQQHKGAAAITDENGLLKGLITDRETLRRLFLSHENPCGLSDMRAEDAMIENPEVLDDAMEIGPALKIMTRHGFRFMPVISGPNRNLLTGIISERELFQHVQEKARHILETKDTLLSYFMHHEPYGPGLPPSYAGLI